MRDVAYPESLVASLILPYRLRGEEYEPMVLPWVELGHGIWPSRAESVLGYKGQASESAPYEAAIIAYEDLERAWKRLPDRVMAGYIRQLCQEGRRVPYRWTVFVEAMTRALNR